MGDAPAEAAFSAAYHRMRSLWTAPPEARDVETPGARTRVQVWGSADAPPLVLLHGWNVTSTMWAPNAAALGAVRRVYAPDTVGDYGFSQVERVPTHEGLLAWIEALLDALGLDAVDLGGMSYGGYLAASFAAHRPARVRRLVMLAPATAFGAFSLGFMVRGLPMLITRRRQEVERYLRWAAVPQPGSEYAALFGGLVDVMHAGHRCFAGRKRLPLPRRLDAEVLARIAAPSLLLYGAEEKLHDPAAAIALARAKVPRLEAALVEGGSHDFTLARPAKVNEAIVGFLAR